MTYIVSSGTLNPTIPYHLFLVTCLPGNTVDEVFISCYLCTYVTGYTADEVFVSGLPVYLVTQLTRYLFLITCVPV